MINSDSYVSHFIAWLFFKQFGNLLQRKNKKIKEQGMRTIYIGSTSRYAGKTLITISLGLYFQNMGLKVGFIKPVGTSPSSENLDKTVDQDAVFVQNILGLDNDPELVTPVVVTRDLQLSVFKKGCPDFMGKILKSFEELKKRQGHNASMWFWKLLTCR